MCITVRFHNIIFPGFCCLKISLQPLDIISRIRRLSVFLHFEVDVIFFLEFEQGSLTHFNDDGTLRNDFSQLYQILFGEIAVNGYNVVSVIYLDYDPQSVILFYPGNGPRSAGLDRRT